uniref:Uncharacterized protein n=1 Tax=Anopheles farauti TaxID=69004 RepID=A0A182QAA9_9DIPT
MSRKRPRDSLDAMSGNGNTSNTGRLTIDETVSITIDPNSDLEDRLATQQQQQQQQLNAESMAPSIDGTPDSMNGSSTRFSSIRIVDEGIEPTHGDDFWPPINEGALNGHVNFGSSASGRPRSSDPVSPRSVSSSNASSSVATSSGFASQHASSGVEHSPPVKK